MSGYGSSTKKNGDKVISASYVRKLLQEGDFEKISELVPQSTYEYLLDYKKREGWRHS